LRSWRNVVNLRTVIGSAALLALLVPLGLVGAAHSSGTYAGRPPRPPASIDRASYELGKKVFAGEFVAEEGDREAQTTLLAALQEKLPSRARTRADLPTYAGRLNSQQIEALQYFLKKRYKVN